MKTKLERTEEALNLAYGALHELACLGNGDCFGDSTGNLIALDCIGRMRVAVDPPPEMETVEVDLGVRWQHIDRGEFYLNKPAPRKMNNYRKIKVTGTYQRTKPQMVERSAAITFTANGWQRDEWQRDDGHWKEVSGKTGTFTWMEEEK